MTCKCGDGSPSFPHSKPEAGDQENICLFKKKNQVQLGWLSSLRSWGESGVGWRSRVGRGKEQAELQKVFWSRMDHLLSILSSTAPSLEWVCVCACTYAPKPV